jgi:2',3'-cyclic-nucleotide 2'-phosphodiesterase (5'-nucleotidase family)
MSLRQFNAKTRRKWKRSSGTAERNRTSSRKNGDVYIIYTSDVHCGVDQFMKLVEMAEFPIICCNFNKQGKLVCAPYIIKEAAGIKIAFVGVTTPKTITASTPKFFQDEKGEYIYDFMQDETGGKLYQAVQDAVDAARADGADYVYLLAHLGNEMVCSPWTYADVVSNTNGIDVVLDGHSHDTEQVVMKNKDGKSVPRSACGTNKYFFHKKGPF